ncbi:MAG: flagellar basal body rod protein FlgC [Clostridia bacterium]|jgi:flagellar basal-body rod protein FlgC|nr:flagellar basal body rod protein FlgC [Clostridia bacterium]
MNLFKAMKISASGLSAERLRMDVISSNIANANSTRSAEGGAYRRQVALLSSVKEQAVHFKSMFKNALGKKEEMGGVRVVSIIEDPSPLKSVYDPSHPDANAEGYVEYPNVDMMKEMVEMITASRAYEANVTVLNSTKSMALKTLEIGKG